MTESVGMLLQSSFAVFKAKLTPILIGAVVFGLLMYGAQTMFQTSSMNAVGGNPAVNMERMEELAKRAEGGDMKAMEELMKEAGIMAEGMGIDIENMPADADMDAMGEAMAKDMFVKILPQFGVFFLISLIVSLLASAYYLVLAVGQASTAQSAFRSSAPLLLPLLGVWLWSFIRSFAWIPVIGIIFAIVLGPRFVLSCVILVKEKKGVLESVSLSYARSRGYWGKIFGNCFVAALCAWLVMVVVGVVAAMLGKEAGLVLTTIVGYGITAYGTIFVVKLSETIMANPLTVKTK